MSGGSVFKKCGCREQVLGPDGVPVVDGSGKPVRRRVGVRCSKLRRGEGGGWNPRHGAWYFQFDNANTPGERVVVSLRAGGRDDADRQLAAVRQLVGIAEGLGEDAAAIAALRSQIATRIRADHKAGMGLPEFEAMRRVVLTGQPIVERLTVGQWLTEWLAGKGALTASTRRVYAAQMRNHLIPHLGRIPLDRLRVGHVTGMMAAIEQQAAVDEAANAVRRDLVAAKKAAWHRGDVDAWRLLRDRLDAAAAYRAPCHAATRSRIRATLSSALSSARRQQLVTMNVAALAEVPSGKAPKALVWTDARVARWRATGEVPSPVMVWTAEQTRVFLARASRHDLAAVFWLLAFTGLRRGEAVGLRWEDIDLEAGFLTVSRQVVQIGWATAITAPKSESSVRKVGTTASLVGKLVEHRSRQDAARAAAGKEWVDSDLVFTRPDGTGIHPDVVSRQFKQLVRDAGLPPIRLHDLRHGAASIALAAGVDLKVVSEMLGHSSTRVTADIYTSVFSSLKRQAADAIGNAIANA